MKKLFICIVLGVISSSVYSGKCQRRDNKCTSASRNINIYKMISRAENGVSDTQRVTNLIFELTKSTGVSPYLLSRLYISLLNSLGGSSKTSSAITALNESTSGLRLGESVDSIAEIFDKIARSENGESDTNRVFAVVSNISVKTRMRLGFISNSYIDIVNVLGGSSKTSQAINVLNKMSNYSEIWNFEDMRISFESLVRKENRNDDAIQNFDLVLKLSKNCNSLIELTNNFNDILLANGNDHSIETRDTFRKLYGH